MKRLAKKFSELKTQNKSAFVAYICAGDPDYSTSLTLLKALPQTGVDIIELGMPFLDPAGDGPIIEEASKRAIAGGMTIVKTLAMVSEFRKNDQLTPLILMGYFNPILKYGLDKFFMDAAKSGVDGMLILDLPMEEEGEILVEISKANLDLIGLITPSTDNDRAKKIAQKSSGFLYLISMLGITGTKVAEISENEKKLTELQKNSNLPIVIGFGIKTPAQAAEFSKIGANGVVVGSVIVKEISDNFLNKKSSQEIVNNTAKLIQDFAQKIHN